MKNIHDQLKDPKRLAALKKTGLVDTPAEQAFDRLTRLATRLIGVPVALVSLVESDRQFFKSSQGLPEPWNERRETPLSHSFCQHNRIAGKPLVIADARENPEFMNNQAIKDLSVVAYLGIPLVIDDLYVIGSFCVIDSKPHLWTQEEIEIVTDLAASVMTEISLQIELNKSKNKQKELQYLKNIIDSSSSPIATCNPDGKMKYANPTFIRKWGIDNSEDLMSKCFWELWDIKDRRDEIIDLLQSNDKLEIDTQAMRNDKSVFVVRLAISPVFDQKSNPIALSFTSTDLTVQKDAEKKLGISRKHEKTIQAIMDNIPGFAFIKDINLNYITANHTFCDLLKIPHDQIQGKTDYDIFPADLAKKYITDDKKIIESGEPLFIEEETTNMNEEGRRFVVATRKHPWLDEKGKIVGIYGLGFDISEVKWAEAAIRENESFLNSLFEAIPIPIFTKDRDGKYKRMNKSFEQFFGISRENSIGKTVFDINPPDLAELYHAKDLDLFEKGGAQEYEVQVKESEGQLHDVIFHKAVLHDNKDHINGIIGTIFDITERKKHEEELRTIMRAVEETSSSVVITDTQGMIQYINPSFSKITGYTKAEIIGENTRLLKSGHHPAAFYQDLWKTIANGNTWKGEMINKKKNETLFWESVSISPVKDVAGVITHYVAIKDDISELKRVENALKASEKQRETILQTTIEGFWLINNEAITVEVNQSMCNILEKPKQEIIGRSIFEYYDHQNAKIVKSELKKRDEGLTSTYEVTIQTASGKGVPCLFNANPLYDSDNNKVGSFSMVTNISKQKQIEEALKKAKHKADIANQSKSTFLANMSHELRTPLNGIIGFTQVLEKQLSDLLNEKQLRFFNTIKQSGDHLLEMVNDILDLSKIEAGKMDINLKPFDLGKMLKRSPSVIQAIAHEKEIEIEASIQPNLGWINGDETRLKQVIYNLLSNAVKFTPSGKKIGISATIKADKFNIEVWDEGEGIPEESLEKIFSPFEQVKGGKVAKEPGTGLGLAISKRLLEVHNGTISVTSEINNGSRFVISLPGRIAMDDQTEIKNTISQIKSKAKAKSLNEFSILVVEDNRANRELIGASLDMYQLDFAESGEESVNMALDKKYDLILMDIQLPEMNGVEAMKQIREKSKTKAPIIALTAFAMKDDEKKYLDEGFDDYVSKPINIESLIQKISKISN